ncbi:LINE-1 reverse transcriptase isogeny [Gossypium australe]|uniref:LINE-1 reverse transcriptase isogeny n=1 Tax=Gossypium australe TaxID=47621 RepID=A0A5B6UV83_9ROSI|nr:LINE-1 reverse transcriptase isogeny [Gossypium australe]
MNWKVCSIMRSFYGGRRRGVIGSSLGIVTPVSFVVVLCKEENLTALWPYASSILSDEAARFFENLYGEIPTPMPGLPLNIFPRLKEQDINFLNKPVLDVEIKKSLFDMALLKASGSDGFHGLFFQSQWDLVGGAVCEWVQGIFVGKRIEEDLNNTFIMLILKKDRPEDFNQFRPIILCSVMYKLVMKEVIHSMRSRKAGRNWMAIKLDLEKAYDKISWDFTDASLIAAGIPGLLKKILWNGVLFKSFKPKRGIRQDITADRWHPIRLTRSRPSLSHFFFADDLVIFGKAEMNQALVLKEILNRFCEFSGHKISSRKSNVFFAKGVDPSIYDQISQLFGYQKVSNLGNYLGVPLLHDRSKLQNWEARKLSFAGRITLAHSVLLAIPNYFMQSLLVPKGIYDEIERIARQCIWEGSAGHSKTTLVRWDSICQPRSCGGLGFRHLHDQNNSFLMKIWFNLVSRKDVLCVRVRRSKYGWKSQLSKSIHRSNCSHLWRSLSKVWPLFCGNLMWSVGDGSTIRGWKDTWIPDVGPLFPYVFTHYRLNLDSTLKDWVLQDDSWNVDMLRIWLSEDMIRHIVSIPPPHSAGGEDRIIWARSGSGSFSVRSAYWALKENTWSPKDDIWKLIWKYQGPQRVCLFLWIVAKQRLFTNSERVRRGIGQSSAYPQCGHDNEDIMHVLRDCLTSKEVWKLVVPPEKQDRFFSDPFQIWF